MLSKSSRQKGFTLIEASIALVVVGLLIMGGVKLMTSSSDVSRYKSTEQQLLEIQQGLTSYYTQFRRLPCPDVGADGMEDSISGGCSSNRGFLPHVTLGMGGNGDAWGERFKYVISPKFVLPDATPPTICYSATMREVTGKVSIYDLTVPLPTAGPNITDFAAFAVLSTGKNGPQTNAGMTGAFTNNGGCTSVNERERENCNDDSVLRTGTAMMDGNSVIFDDMLVWIGDMQLVSLLRQTGACDVENTESSSFDPSKPTDTDFTTGATVHSGDYEGRDSVSTSNSGDKVVITGDLKKDIDLKDGDNILLVKGNMSNDFSENILATGSGNDIIRFEGGVYESISTGSGNDQLEVQGSVNLSSSITNDTINMGSGNDQIRIYGNVSNSRILLGSGENTIYVGGTISSGVRITAEDGSGILYYNSSTKPSSSALTLGSTVTIKCRINDAWTDCP